MPRDRYRSSSIAGGSPQPTNRYPNERNQNRNGGAPGRVGGEKKKRVKNPKVGSFVKELQLNLAIAKLTGD
jgi:hypothetical protein